ncbi:MAG: hypothetical protein HXS52_03880 [Theionarchaea archaeon]|nr:hypothetical protein [Theionarchaea archaeon]
MDLNLMDIWGVAGILMGFQIASFTWRISREVDVGERDYVTWLPPADLLNLTSMVTLAGGVFVFPVLTVGGLVLAEHSFGLAVILFMGYPFALAGHYDMYNMETPRSYEYFPLQEKIVILLVACLAILYIVGSLAHA